jgi:SAM-dependent methyltransferase
MPNWNELFYDANNRDQAPEREIFRLIVLLEKTFTERPLRLWDLGCGAGRHTAAIAGSGSLAYASDNAPKAVELTREWLRQLGLHADVRMAEMTDSPWADDVSFHGVFSWLVIHHNTLRNIKDTVSLINRKLVPNGLLLATVVSDKACGVEKGQEIEPGTFISEIGDESGIPHHYFTESGIRDLFDTELWEIIILAEQVTRYIETADRFWTFNPFRYTTWEILVKKRN